MNQISIDETSPNKTFQSPFGNKQEKGQPPGKTYLPHCMTELLSLLLAKDKWKSGEAASTDDNPHKINNQLKQ